MVKQARNAIGWIALNVVKFAATKLFPNSNRIRAAHHRIKNWYTAGFPLLTGDVPFVPAIVQDARFDQNYITRREMLRRMRYWTQNSAIVESILSVGERYTVGPSGLHVSFYPVDDNDDADNSWYDRAELVCAEVMQDFGWNGESLETLLKIGYRCQKADGDLMYIKTRKRKPLLLGNQAVLVSQPCLQIVEGHRIETPFNKWTNEGVTTLDGIEYEIVLVNGRPMMKRLGFWVRQGFGEFEQNTSWDLIEEGDFFYLRNEQRANQPRAVSDFYSVEEDIAKLEALLSLEMKAQNSQSKRAVYLTNAAGQINPLDPRIEAANRARGVTPPVSEDWFASVQRFREFWERAYGDQVYAGKAGETVTFQAPNRPSEATLNLFELLVNRICAGTKMPRCLIIEKISGQSAKGQGTEVRAQLDSADGYFEGDFQKWKRFVIGAVIYDFEWRVKNDPRLADPPADWRSCIHVQQPKACNVDVAYNAQATTMELASGQTNYDLVYGPRGLSFRREIKKLAHQQKFMERLGVKVTLPALLPGQIPLDGGPAAPPKKPELQEA